MYFHRPLVFRKLPTAFTLSAPQAFPNERHLCPSTTRAARQGFPPPPASPSGTVPGFPPHSAQCSGFSPTYDGWWIARAPSSQRGSPTVHRPVTCVTEPWSTQPGRGGRALEGRPSRSQHVREGHPVPRKTSLRVSSRTTVFPTSVAHHFEKTRFLPKFHLGMKHWGSHCFKICPQTEVFIKLY